MDLLKLFEKSYTVTDEVAVHFMGAEAPPVLSTPGLLAWMELASRECVSSLLGAGQDTVGVSATLKHLAPTPVGAEVRVITRLVGVEGRIYAFEIEAFDETEKIAEAAHQRASILVAKFADRVRAKMKR
jgi:fluoroacetyl-CoA thioesterase